MDLWKVPEVFPLFDLSLGFYIAKFTQAESVSKVLKNGPWFINGHYLSIKIWEPIFVPKSEKVTHSVVWARLPNMHAEFYDAILLTKIGNSIEKLLKVDACTNSTLQGHYARLCVQILMEEPVLSAAFKLGTINSPYEGNCYLCISCGRFGHIHSRFPHQEITPTKEMPTQGSPDSTPSINQEWLTVKFPPHKKSK